MLPSGKTNLIALDLGARGDPIETLERLIELARADDLGRYTVARELIALRRPAAMTVRSSACSWVALASPRQCSIAGTRSIRSGLPNSISHGLTFIAYIAQLVLKLKSSFLPSAATATELVMPTRNPLSGRFAFLAVTTLEKMLLSNTMGGEGRGPLKVVAIEESPTSVFRALFAGLTGGYKGKKIAASTSRKWTRSPFMARART